MCDMGLSENGIYPSSGSLFSDKSICAMVKKCYVVYAHPSHAMGFQT